MVFAKVLTGAAGAEDGCTDAKDEKSLRVDEENSRRMTRVAAFIAFLFGCAILPFQCE
jgi:hypothetical protein